MSDAVNVKAVKAFAEQYHLTFELDYHYDAGEESYSVHAGAVDWPLCKEHCGGYWAVSIAEVGSAILVDNVDGIGGCCREVSAEDLLTKWEYVVEGSLMRLKEV